MIGQLQALVFEAGLMLFVGLLCLGMMALIIAYKD